MLPSYLRGYITDNKTGVRTEITNDIANWREIDVKQVRTDFSGVYVELQNALHICRAAKTLVQNAFHTHMLGMDMTFEIERRKRIIGADGVIRFGYDLIHSMRLNPGTYKEYAEYIEIEGKSLTFDALLRSVGKTKYDFGVMSVIDEWWRYGHNRVFVNGDWTLPENQPIEIPFATAGNFSLSAMLNDGKMPLGGVENDFKSQQYVNLATNADHRDVYFFMSDADAQGVVLSIDFVGTYTYSPDTADDTNISISVDRLDAEGNFIERMNTEFFYDTNKTGTISIVHKVDRLPITINKGERLRIYVSPRLDAGEGSPDVFTITKFNRFVLVYSDQSKMVYDIPVVTAETMANYLLYRMAGGNDDTGADPNPAKRYTAQIDTDTDNPWAFDHYLVAAESIRGFENANFHANFNDFLEYMQFLGYEYETDETARVVHFRKRAAFFDPSITALELTKGEVSDMEIAADDTYAYSTVRVGYEKPDIENTNGRFAICGAFDYSTDHMNLGDVKDSSLEIMCPYKADPVEIETLSWTRGEKTKDQKADNDIFMLAGELSGGYVVESRRAEYTVTDTDLNQSIGWYNVPYIPYFIAKRNEGRIGIAVRNLTFTGTDAYRDAKLSGVVTVDPYSNLAVEGLFLPITYDFEVGTLKGLPPQNLRRGLVRLRWRGGTYQGYIKELIKNDCAERSQNWVLYAR
jgi:hypothetical protein